ncbi:hypothetical protein AX15_000923 [Amanita polypyramis BW_CC]|nr:hypothetical protein AX15_000923 [Amanita polypyramis BW_CC]
MLLVTRGVIAAVQVGLYLPITIVTCMLVFRYALQLADIDIVARITDGALIIAGGAAKTEKDLYTPAYIIQTAALALLMAASLGFIGLVGQSVFSDTPRVSHMLRFLGFLAILALAFTVAGGLLGSSVAPTQGGTGCILRRLGAGVFAGLYLLIVFAHFGAFSYRWRIKSNRRKLLVGMFLALVPLGARTAYAVIAAWSSSDLYGRRLSENVLLSRLNPVTGEFGYFLGLSVVCELVVSVIYLFSSTYIMRRWRR